MTKRVAIVGGGVAGLAAAYELARLTRGGVAVQGVLFEASTRLGGIVETVREGGFVIECGPDAWVTEKPWARELAEELGLEDEVMASNDAGRKTYVLIDRKLQAMPDGMRMMVPVDLDALDASELFSAEAKQAYREEAGRAPGTARSARGRADDDVGDLGDDGMRALHHRRAAPSCRIPREGARSQGGGGRHRRAQAAVRRPR